MSLTIQDETLVAANGSNGSVLNGTRLEFAEEDGTVDIYSTGSAIGLRQDLRVGSNEVIESSAVNVQNRLPVVPDDVLAADIPVVAGDKISLATQNTTIGALTYRWRVEFTPFEEELEQF